MSVVLERPTPPTQQLPSWGRWGSPSSRNAVYCCIVAVMTFAIEWFVTSQDDPFNAFHGNATQGMRVAASTVLYSALIVPLITAYITAAPRKRKLSVLENTSAQPFGRLMVKKYGSTITGIFAGHTMVMVLLFASSRIAPHELTVLDWIVLGCGYNTYLVFGALGILAGTFLRPTFAVAGAGALGIAAFGAFFYEPTSFMMLNMKQYALPIYKTIQESTFWWHTVFAVALLAFSVSLYGLRNHWHTQAARRHTAVAVPAGLAVAVSVGAFQVVGLQETDRTPPAEPYCAQGQVEVCTWPEHSATADWLLPRLERLAEITEGTPVSSKRYVQEGLSGPGWVIPAETHKWEEMLMSGIFSDFYPKDCPDVNNVRTRANLTIAHVWQQVEGYVPAVAPIEPEEAQKFLALTPDEKKTFTREAITEVMQCNGTL